MLKIKLILLLIGACFGHLQSQLDTLLVESERLNRTIAVYIEASQKRSASTIYYTDGKKLIDNGALERIRILEQQGKILPAHHIFVSTIDPVTGIDYRNDYFFCNPDYLGFFEKELIQEVDQFLGLSKKQIDRSLVGISFGGLNAAYFSAKSENLFSGFALLSPITYPCESIFEDIAFSPNRGLRIYLSTGLNDAEQYIRSLRGIYLSKEYKIKVIQMDKGHDFQNWNTQWKEVLQSSVSLFNSMIENILWSN